LEGSSPFTLRVPKNVADLLRNMHPTLKKKVRSALDTILSDPVSGKALKDDLAGLRSFRIGRVRIIYKISKTEVQLVTIGPRSSIYEETSRLVGRDEARDKKSPPL
jgi:mRNA interferase RelE/StbE